MKCGGLKGKAISRARALIGQAPVLGQLAVNAVSGVLVAVGVVDDHSFPEGTLWSRRQC